MNNPLRETWENEQETIKNHWDPIWERYKINFEHFSTKNKRKGVFSEMQHACGGGEVLLQKLEGGSAAGKRSGKGGTE